MFKAFPAAAEFDAAVVGAGAAGLAAAIFAARANPALRVALLDGARRPGAKILVSGGGRCNVTNARVSATDFSGGGPHAVRRVLAAFDERKTAAFFREIAVFLHEEEDGKLFPDSHRARSVLDALLAEAARRGVHCFWGRRVLGIGKCDGGFELRTAAGNLLAGRAVLATGGLSLPKTGSDGAGYAFAQGLGHSLVPTTPALAGLVLKGDFHASLSGVSHETQLTLRAEGQKPVRMRGAMLWTHFGVSGPAPMNISRFWHRAQMEGHKPYLGANFLPGRDCNRALLALASEKPSALLRNALPALIPARLAEAILRSLPISSSSMARLRREDRLLLARALEEWPLPVSGSRGYAFAEATAGGVPLGEIRPSTMESKICPGLHLAGEILDVDGRIGGFNFQWAWSSGFVAGTALAGQ